MHAARVAEMNLPYTPSDDLLKRVRAALLLRDETLSSWARANGCKRQNLTKA